MLIFGDVIPIQNFIIKKIQKDGNCFYRTLSYYFRETEDDYNEFRELITSYISNNADEYIEFVADEDVNIPEDADELLILKMKRDYILKYSQEASKDGEWAGDIEIATASILFNTQINMYTLNVNGYEFYNKYNPEDNMNGGVRDTVNILYINENHFNLLIPNDNNIINSNNNIIQKGINFKEFKNLILNDQSQLKRKIDKKLNLKFKSKSVYVDYPITSRKDYYNEIFKYINDNKIMPKRLEYSVNKNRKTVEKKEGNSENSSEKNIEFLIIDFNIFIIIKIKIYG